MFTTTITNSTSMSEGATVSSGTRVQYLSGLNQVVSTISDPQQPRKIKKKRSLPGNPDPDAEIIALSPKALLATNRFVCEICLKGFQRDQNLQLHRRGHNLPWKLKQRSSKEVKKKAYVCPEPSCVHHNPSRALGDLTGIKKHYCRKHGEKKWKCEKCSKIYAVQSDWKAHSKTCGTKEYRCDCGTLFSRKDSFITHRAFCDALAEESAKLSTNQLTTTSTNPLLHSLILFQTQQNLQQNHHFTTSFSPWYMDSQPPQQNPNPTTLSSPSPFENLRVAMQAHATSAAAHMSATALLQKAATVGATAITGPDSSLSAAAACVGDEQQTSMMSHVTGLGRGEFGMTSQLDSVVQLPEYMATLKSDHRLTRDFLGLTEDADGGGGIDMKGVLNFTGDMLNHHQAHHYHHHHHHHRLLKPQEQGFEFLRTTTAPETWGNC
ncbi:protein indeterminate-domain 12-like [Lotus japonicus]|uniref:protein indeterminate-domain 12-like n=1 Tax=Lotus japonicus TaxID=34305 RepID=UPI00258EE0BE|nr:protein indeterminate-domain 12-like [Lotus japonicus]